MYYRSRMIKTIVVVDAEPVVRSVVTRILEREGYAVRSTGDVKEALTLVKSAKPDLVVTNVSLPGITGHDAMRLFKKEFPELRVLMVSGLPDHEVLREWIREEGFDAFPKPFTADQLTAKVKEVLS